MITLNTNFGDIVIELNFDDAPLSSANFLQYCRDGFYTDTIFHRVIGNFMIQGGDFVNGDGTGCVSIYGSKFDDEAFVGRHTGPGLLSSANSGANTNGCQFFVTCAKTEWLDDKHVVFGRVLGDGMLVIRKIENVATGGGNKPKLPCVIEECGEM